MNVALSYSNTVLSVKGVFGWVEALSSSTSLRESIYGYPILLTSHVVAMCMFLGLIIMMDLRLAGWGFQRTPFSELQKRMFPWQALGLIMSSTTGLLLFYSQPMRYYGKVFFWMKLGSVGLAGVNALVFHLTTYRSVAKWDRSALPFEARLAAIMSLALWTGVVVFGRLTAYDWLTFKP